MIWLDNFLHSILGNVSDVVHALVLLLIALLAAFIARLGTVKLLGLLKLDKKFAGKTGDPATMKNAITIIGKFVFAIVFLLFLPGALDKLGMGSVSAPISGMISSFINYLPNLLAAAIIVMFGTFLAKLVMELLANLLKKTRVDTLQERCGIKLSEGSRISDIVARLVYAVILIFAVVAALQVLRIEAISGPAVGMLNQIVAMIPNIFAAIILVTVGTFIGNMAGKLLEGVLAGSGFDKALASIRTGESKTRASHLVGVIVRIVIDVIFVVEAVQILKLEVFTSLGTAIISYLPNAIAAVVIVGIALFVANMAKDFILRRNAEAKLTANGAKAGILAIAAFMALSQLGIAPSIVNTAFIAVITAVAIAAAIAFGVGGIDAARKVLNRVDEKVNTDEKPEDKK